MKTPKIVSLILLILISLILIWRLNAQEVVPQTQTTLKSYFLTGERPTQTNYFELIDTLFWYVNQTYSNALAAAASANEANQVYQASANFTLSYNTNLTLQVNSSNNVSGVSVALNTVNVFPAGTTGHYINAYTVVVEFANGLQGTNYSMSFSAPGSTFGVLNSSDWNLGWQIDHFNNGDTNVSSTFPYLGTTTNLAFTVVAATPALLNGANIIVIAQ